MKLLRNSGSISNIASKNTFAHTLKIITWKLHNLTKITSEAYLVFYKQIAYFWKYTQYLYIMQAPAEAFFFSIQFPVSEQWVRNSTEDNN